jgi:phage baseplate assembly protein gpV
MNGFNTAEADRRIGNMVQIGTVTEIDNATATVRVQIGDLPSQPLKVAQLASGAIRFHWMPSPGEQVVVYAPSGDMARAFVQGALPRSGDEIAPGETEPSIDLGGGTMRIIGNLWVDGDIVVTGDVIADGISLVHHIHPHGDPAGMTGEPT